MTTTAAAQQSVLPLIGRFLLAVLFLLSGLSKLADPAGTLAYIGSVGLPLPIVGYVVAIVVEIVGGALLLLGYRAKLASLALAIFTVAAAVLFHHAFGDQNQFIHFMKDLAITGGLLQVAAFGAGSYSLDRRRAPMPAPTGA